MKKRAKLTIIMTFMAAILIMPFTAHVEGEEVSYSVEPLISNNQIDERHSYFDLKVRPNQTQTLQTIIHNNENKEITVLLSVHNATTNSNGMIVYEDTKEIDSSLKVPLTDILTFEKDQVVIPAGEAKTVTATLEMPAEEYDGIILGGLHFEKVNDAVDQSEGIHIQNQYAYVIGVQLRENYHEVQPNLNLHSAQPELFNHRPVISALLQNSEPILMSDLHIHALVYKDRESKPVKEKRQTINMAPNSTMNVVIDWDNQPLEPGDYLLVLHATNGDQSWEWEESFVVEKDEAEQINTGAVGLEDDNDGVSTPVKIGFVVLIMIILSLIAYIGRLKHEQDYNGEGRLV